MSEHFGGRSCAEPSPQWDHNVTMRMAAAKRLALARAPLYRGRMLESLYLICGDDEYLVSTKAQERVAELVPPADREFGLEIIDGAADTVDAALAALRRLKEAMQTASFFTAQRVIWFKDVSFLIDNVVGKSTAVKERVTEIAELIKAGLMPGQILLVTAPKVHKRYAFYKACKSAGKIEEFAVPEKAHTAEAGAKTRAQTLIKEAGLKMPAAAFETFMARAGVETRSIVNELQKLSLYLGDRREVKTEDVMAVVCASRSALAWDLADAVGDRKLAEAIGIARQLLFQKQSAVGLLIALENRVRDLMIHREALEKGWLRGRDTHYKWGNLPPEVNAAMSESMTRDPRATHPFRIGILGEQARHFTRADLRRCRGAVLEAHRTLVSSSLPAAVVLELLLVRMLARDPANPV
ncbi:MAG: DNA polymerase III subunit delta [Lysobacterales bacterium]|nr:MAG: DNA polymerase III subunit delta [Xanthomonadales bacterium]